jgi:large subunit ribosomal protein L28
MSRRCDVCSKEPGFGNAVQRLGKRALVRRVKSRTPRRWLPNLQPVRTTTANGTPVKLKVCTSCLKKGKVQRKAA